MSDDRPFSIVDIERQERDDAFRDDPGYYDDRPTLADVEEDPDPPEPIEMIEVPKHLIGMLTAWDDGTNKRWVQDDPVSPTEAHALNQLAAWYRRHG